MFTALELANADELWKVLKNTSENSLMMNNFLFFEGNKHLDTCLISFSGGQIFLISRKVCQPLCE